MARLPAVSDKRVLRALRKAGFRLHHVAGSHHEMERVAPPRLAVTVPVHGNRDIPIGTLRAILDKAELTADEFIKFL